jgi:hypothetical protein
MGRGLEEFVNRGIVEELCGCFMEGCRRGIYGG